MNTLGRFLSVALVSLLAVGGVRSDEDKDLRAVIAKAIKAKGPEQNEIKYKGMSMKGTGTFYGLGEGIPFTGDWVFQGRTKYRWSLEIKVADQMLTITHVLDGDKGWQKINDDVMPLADAELAEEKADLYAKWVTSLTPLKDKAFKLAALGEIKVGGRAATGVRVSHDDRRDINLFFDNTNNLLVKTEFQVKDVKGGGDKDMSQESFYTDFKEFKGTKYPTKVTIKREDKQFVEVEMTDIRPLETVDDALFARP